MIRKPDAHEFRESNAVTAIRDARTVAIEGAKGVRDGTASFVTRAMLGLFSFGFVMSIVWHAGAVVLLLALAGGAAWWTKRGKRRDADANAQLGLGRCETRVAAAAGTTERYELSVGPVGRRAATVAVPAILFFPTSLLGYMLPFAAAGVAYLALAMLLVARLFGDRTVLRFDAQALTVVGLLGEATVLWSDVDDVTIRTSSLFNLKVLFTSGARKNLHVLARVNRLGGPATLYIPVDLLGLDSTQLHALVTRLLICRAGAGDVIPPAAAQADPAALAYACRSVPEPSVMAVAAVAPRPTPAVAMADAPFDPDAIIARYMAEREQLRTDHRPDLPATPRRAGFGRKAA